MQWGEHPIARSLTLPKTSPQILSQKPSGIGVIYRARNPRRSASRHYADRLRAYQQRPREHSMNFPTRDPFVARTPLGRRIARARKFPVTIAGGFLSKWGGKL